MCEANAYILKEGKEELVLEDISISVRAGWALPSKYLRRTATNQGGLRN
jgi:hypothetical protein